MGIELVIFVLLVALIVAVSIGYFSKKKKKENDNRP